MEVVSVREPYSGRIEKIEIPAVEYVRKPRGKKLALRHGARRHEMRTGQKSAQRILRETLEEVFAGVGPEELAKSKWGDLHGRLAECGVLMRKVEHDGAPGLVFSADGERWVKGSSIDERFTFSAISKSLGGKTWRNARARTLERAAEVQRTRMAQNEGVESAAPGPAKEARHADGIMETGQKPGEYIPEAAAESAAPCPAKPAMTAAWRDNLRRMLRSVLEGVWNGRLRKNGWAFLHDCLALEGILVKKANGPEPDLVFSGDGENWVSGRSLGGSSGKSVLCIMAIHEAKYAFTG